MPAHDDPHASVAALASVLDCSAPIPRPGWLVQPFLLDAIARAWQDARVTKIWAGSNEIMKEIIGRDLGL